MPQATSENSALTARLADRYDAMLFDLDGVIYVGEAAVPGAPEAAAALSELGKRLLYVTNNAAPTAASVAEHLKNIGFSATEDMVLTSAQVAVSYLQADLPAGAKILVAGTSNLRDLIAEAGFTPVFSADDEPQAVLQGYDPNIALPTLDEACLALGRGAKWYATNADTSRPSPRGIVTAAGSMIAALSVTLGRSPVTFGKPALPMLTEAVRRSGAERPIFVGDRLDTDIAGATLAGMDSLLVFSGVHGARDLIAAVPERRPTAIGADISALLSPSRHVEVALTHVTCQGQTAQIRAGIIDLVTQPENIEAELSALWAIAHLAWSNPGSDAAAALDALKQVK
ncbi:MAG: HAD-IIA family hydrolase [Propionibacteriaceae bacterium]|nr:HAD-IIA family hydrolase [Propionibacteriaceae bacterium]